MRILLTNNSQQLPQTQSSTALNSFHSFLNSQPLSEDMSVSHLLLPLPPIYKGENMEETFHLRTTNPETWMSSYLDGTISELWQALEDDFHERKQTISFNQMWLERFQDPNSYYRYPMSPEQGALSLASIDSQPSIQDSLHQFEEDFEYENWVSSDETQTTKKIQLDNLHTICAAQWDSIEKPFEEIGIEYVGQLTEEKATSVKQTGKHFATVVKAYEAEDESNITIEIGDTVVVENDLDEDWWFGYVFMKEYEYKGYFPSSYVRTTENSTYCQIGEVFLKDRYKVKAKVVTHHPSDQKGFAKATSDFGDIYIPEKFRNFLPPIDETVIVTVALQDVGDNTHKANSFRLTAIYIH